MIVIKNKRTKPENILKEYPDAMIFDVTSKGEYKRLSPFYPHGGIPGFKYGRKIKYRIKNKSKQLIKRK